MLEEARSRAQKKPGGQACVKGTLENDEHTSIDSNDSFASEHRETGINDLAQTLEPISRDTSEKNASQRAHAPDEPPVEEVDEDNSVFSDQDREDFEEPPDDDWDDSSGRARQRYEWTNWFYHV